MQHTSYLDILKGLSETASKLNLLVADLSITTATAKPSGKWSIQEHVGHLLTIESLWVARLDDFVAGNPILRPWNGTNADTDSGQFNLQRMKRILRDFDELRTNHILILEEYSEQANGMVARNERMDKSYSLLDHVRMMLEHDREHLRIIESCLG